MTVITKEDIQNGNYTQDDILDYYDNLYYNNLHRDALKNLSEDQFDEITTHTEGNTTFTVGTLDGVSVIINEKKKSTIPFKFTKPDFTKVKQEASDLIEGIKNFSEGTRFGLVQAYNNTKILLNEASGGRLKQFEDIVNKAGKDFFDIDVKIPIESLRPENETIGTLGGEITGQYIIPGMFVYRYIPNILLAEPVVVGLFSGRDDGNLATAIKEMAPNFAQNNEVAKIILDGLSVDADDTEIEARIKNVTADAPIGIVFSGLFSMLKYFKKNPEKLKEVQNEYKDAGAAATPDELKKNFKSTQPFYSNVVNAIREIDIPEGGMDVTQFTNTIRNTKGIKQSELDDMGFDEFFLDDKPAIVTQERVNEFLETKDLSKNVKTTVLGEADNPNSNEILKNQDMIDVSLVDANSYQDAELIVMNNERLYNEFQDFIKDIKNTTNRQDIDLIDEDDFLEEFLKTRGITRQPSTLPTKFDEYVLPGGEDYREMLLTTKGTQIFTKDHFRRAGANVPEGENILAHIRFNTRTIDGKKVLFIEEIQSDLHQAGRQVGYIDKSLKAKRQKLITQLNDLIKEVGEFKVADDPRYLEIERQIKIIDASSGTIPNAPFKKNWHELSMKRIIKYAIDNGFEGISFTPASVQAARYPGADADFTVFYDQVLPKFVNKFSKKYNAKLVNTNLSQSGLKFNKNRSPYNYENTVLRDAKNLEDAFDLIDRNDYLLNEFALFVRDETTEFASKDEAMKFIDNAPESELVPYKESFLMNDYGLDLTGDLDNVVPYLEFTPEMINTIKSEGVPVAALEDRETSATRTV